MTSPRANVRVLVPEVDATLAALNAAAHNAAATAGLSELLVELVQLRASQINGCSFCLRIHNRKALAAGEGTDRLAVLPAWRETAYFDDVERAALDLTEAITLIAEGRVADSVYESAARVLTEQQIAAVSWLAVAINSYNRVIIASRPVVGP